ncbi:MAG: hypothetical protein Ct9H90mP30_6200 [Actinomycetota bacterium]|nr:MAG: hypothetical protein Ct9H90mP30_6200 [Actinomycetota bacterium]
MKTLPIKGYAPSGVALYIETLTDNRNRTGSEVRSTLSKNGGHWQNLDLSHGNLKEKV